MQRRRWITATPARQLTAATLALIVAAVIGSVIATHLNDPPPQAPVRHLFTALAARDTAVAGRLADCTASPLCDGDALASGYQPPEDVHIGHASTSRTRVAGVIQESAAIDVSYRMPGDDLPVATVIDVQRSGGFGQDWSISGGAYGMSDRRVTIPAERDRGRRHRTHRGHRRRQPGLATPCRRYPASTASPPTRPPASAPPPPITAVLSAPAC